MVISRLTIFFNVIGTTTIITNVIIISALVLPFGSFRRYKDTIEEETFINPSINAHLVRDVRELLDHVRRRRVDDFKLQLRSSE